MTKKHFIAMADMIREHNRRSKSGDFDPFTDDQILALAEFNRQQNGNFKRERWISYINGECGPNGGTPKILKSSPSGPSMGEGGYVS